MQDLLLVAQKAWSSEKILGVLKSWKFPSLVPFLAGYCGLTVQDDLYVAGRCECDPVHNPSAPRPWGDEHLCPCLPTEHVQRLTLRVLLPPLEAARACAACGTVLRLTDQTEAVFTSRAAYEKLKSSLESQVVPVQVGQVEVLLAVFAYMSHRSYL